jgi:hypothetical protein
MTPLANPYLAPTVNRQQPTLHWRETIDPTALERERELLRQHCENPTAMAQDRAWSTPRPRGLALTLACLGATAFVVGVAIAALALILERDRTLLLVLASVCSCLALILGVSARSRMRGDREHGEDDRSDPVDTMRAFWEALGQGSGGEIVCRLAPSARTATAEAPDLSPHRSRAAYHLDEPESAIAWSKTFARSDPIQPRWLMIRSVDLELIENDVARVRSRIEVRWWALWGVIAVGGLFMPLLFFALIPGLLLYLALMERRVVVTTKHLVRGPDARWYVLRPDVTPEQ